MKKFLKVTAIVLAVLIVILLGAAGGGYLYIDGLLSSIDRTEISGDLNLTPDEIYEEPTVEATDSHEEIQQAQQQFQQIQAVKTLENANLENILLIGCDRRNTSENGRSDAMMIVTVNHDTGKIHITSLMRAMYVCIPRPDGDTWGMLNAAYSWGGPKLLIETIENNFRLDIDRYVMVDFSSFKEAVDILGGVEITITGAEGNHIGMMTGNYLPAGTHTLNGSEALTYARIRYTDNDFVRTSRQRTVIEALIKKSLTTDIGTLITMMEEILPLVNTDMTNGEILMYLAQAPGLLKNPITQRMLPIANESGETFAGLIYVGGREMYKLDFEANIKALHEFMLS